MANIDPAMGSSNGKNGKRLTERQKSFYRNLLYQQLQALMQGAEKTLVGMAGEKAAFPDPTDRALHESSRNRDLRIRDRERKLIQKVKQALARIEDGTFGICEGCGEEIPEKRLRARPVTTLCIACKEQQEAIERATNRA